MLGKFWVWILIWTMIWSCISMNGIVAKDLEKLQSTSVGEYLNKNIGGLTDALKKWGAENPEESAVSLNVKLPT